MTIPLPAIPQDEGPALPDPTEAPTPSGKYAGWFPAMIDIPGLARMQRARAYATPDGLYVWNRPPRDGTENPDVWLPIRWDLTGPMPRDAMARIQGLYLATEYGIVHVTPSGGCGCGSRLKQWAPAWASTSLAGWPSGASTTTEPAPEPAPTEPPDVDADDEPDPEPARKQGGKA